jgi:hypothetical protein
MTLDEFLKIENPTEVVQMAAVNRDGYILQHIHNPSEAVCLVALNENKYAFDLIRNYKMREKIKKMFNIN